MTSLLEKKRACVDRSNMQAVYAQKSPFYKVAKRALDVALSGVALAALSPVFLATAVAIVIEDGRPGIYAAPREGKGGTPFSMY
ncbi:MAG: sugar transferase [Eggerthellaceae bacterium]|nr:sugar transferase [Eggerthellaceae bacterium]